MEMYKIQICVGEIISGAITKVDDNVVGKKPIKMGGNKRNRRREKWIKGRFLLGFYSHRTLVLGG